MSTITGGQAVHDGPTPRATLRADKKAAQLQCARRMTYKTERRCWDHYSCDQYAAGLQMHCMKPQPRPHKNSIIDLLFIFHKIAAMHAACRLVLQPRIANTATPQPGTLPTAAAKQGA